MFEKPQPNIKLMKRGRKKKDLKDKFKNLNKQVLSFENNDIWGMYWMMWKDDDEV